MKLEYKYNDGGRSQYYKTSMVRDCVTRAIAIASNKDYKEIYNLVKSYLKPKKSPNNGVPNKLVKKIMTDLGYQWVSKMSIGTGCTTHLSQDEIPMDKIIICNVSRHVVAVVNGVVNDTFDCTRDGNRCVYGYWIVK